MFVSKSPHPPPWLLLLSCEPSLLVHHPVTEPRKTLHGPPHHPLDPPLPPLHPILLIAIPKPTLGNTYIATARTLVAGEPRNATPHTPNHRRRRRANGVAPTFPLPSLRCIISDRTHVSHGIHERIIRSTPVPIHRTNTKDAPSTPSFTRPRSCLRTCDLSYFLVDGGAKTAVNGDKRNTHAAIAPVILVSL